MTQPPPPPVQPPSKHRESWLDWWLAQSWIGLSATTVALIIFASGFLSVLEALGWIGSGVYTFVAAVLILLFLVLIMASLVAWIANKLLGKQVRKRPKRPWIAASAGLLAGGFLFTIIGLAISSFHAARQSAATIEAANAPWQTTQILDGQYEISLPATWEPVDEIPLDPGYAAVADRRRDLWLIVGGGPRADFTATDLESYAQEVAQIMLADTPGARVTGITSGTAGARPAVTVMSEAPIEGARIIFTVQCIDTGTHWIDFRFWAVASRFRQNQEEFDRIAASLRPAGPSSDL